MLMIFSINQSYLLFEVISIHNCFNLSNCNNYPKINKVKSIKYLGYCLNVTLNVIYI